MSLSDFHEFVKRKLHPPLTDEAKLEELRKWETFASKRIKQANPRPFEAIATRGDLADYVHAAIADADSEPALKRIFDEARQRVEHKSIQATRLLFESEFEDTLSQARDGQLTRGQWAFRVRALIREFGTQAYRDGLEDGGVDPDELSDEDASRISELIREQSQYVTAFGSTLFSSGDKSLTDDELAFFAAHSLLFTDELPGKAITDAEAANKPAMWFNKSITPFYDAGKLSANANGMYEWVIGATEESCRTCLKANGQRHRLRSWHRAGILPQSTGIKELECKGFNCKCNLIQITGRARGRLDRIPTG